MVFLVQRIALSSWRIHRVNAGRLRAALAAAAACVGGETARLTVGPFPKRAPADTYCCVVCPDSGMAASVSRF